MTASKVLSGHCDTAFTPVKDAYASLFHDFPELGSSLGVMVDGRLVVDLWGGFADIGRTRPWQRDTIAQCHSTIKGPIALCAHRLVEDGRLDLDAPVSRYWPEFAQGGKATLPVRYLLTHQAGLAAIREPLPVGAAFDWHVMTTALAAQEPWWEPGTRHGYHLLTYVWLVGEVIRRVSGQSLGAYFRDTVAAPLGLDFLIDLPDADVARLAELPPILQPDAGAFNPLATGLPDPNSMLAKAFANPPDMAAPDVVNRRVWQQSGAVAHGNGRALARFYGMLASGGELDGVRIVKPATVAAAIVEQVRGVDALLGMEDRFALGFMLPSPMRRFGRGPRTFGHPGAGGSLGFADPDAGLAFGYVPNQAFASGEGGDTRWGVLMDALYGCL